MSTSDRNRPTMNFLQIPSAKLLKFALQTFSDLDMIPDLSAKLDFDSDGFNITVHNPFSNYCGHLFLKPYMFQCTIPVKNTTLMFRELFQNLAALTDAVDDKYLFIYNGEGFHRLKFLLSSRTESTIEFSTEFGVPTEEPKLPETALFREAVVSASVLRSMLQLLQQEQLSREVSVYVNDNNATLKVGSKAWTVPFLRAQGRGSEGVEAGVCYYARFPFAHAESLMKVSDLDAGFLVLADTKNTNDIVLKFFLENLGYLEYVMKPIPDLNSVMDMP